MQRRFRALAIAALAPVLAAAQSGPFVTGEGVTLPVAARVAPGQVTTLFVAGAPIVEPSVADGAPLPASLGGFSVSIRQNRGTVPLLSAPLFAVWPVPTCEPGLALDCAGEPLTAITLQIPFELAPNGLAGTLFSGSEAVLSVSLDGRTSGEFRLIPVTDRVHVLNSCDSALPFDFRGDPRCRPVVSRADGSLVSQSNPAAPGETLVLYAFGLGSPAPGIASGEPAPPPDPSAMGLNLRLRFDFSPNASASRVVDFDAAPRPLFAGLVEGFVGLYQVNFRVPEPPAELAPCFSAISSNLTVGVAGRASFDGAALCVQPEREPASAASPQVR